jgi:KUP system potassium uptake protein
MNGEVVTHGDMVAAASESSAAAAGKSPATTLGAAPQVSLAASMLAALGVVYGDIGTSPLYALRECFHGPLALPASVGNILGVLSLIFWALLLIISLKYLTFVMRADNDGEGGILALMVLASQKLKSVRQSWVVMILGLFGAGLLYGDGIITPAISVLSAVEGLRVASPSLGALVLPITVGILVALFVLQHRGTARVGRLFGPVMIVWFGLLGILGLGAIVRHPAVLGAVSPHHAVMFFVRNQLGGFLILGAVFLVVTGGEALYADMGHFGARPIRWAWFAFVLPALVVNYFGQGALLIAEPSAVDNPFYHLAPAWLQYPLVALAMAATVIASQAVITGAFSLAYQAVHLGLSPRMAVVHTSKDERGQVYVPLVNWVLLVAVVGLVLVFQSSSNLASAYGMAVTTTMVITALLLYVVARQQWGWSALLAASVVGLILLVDLGFFTANLAKVLSGGWLPLLVGIGVCVLMTTWQRGRELVDSNIQPQQVDANLLFAAEIAADPPHLVAMPAVYLTSSAGGIPLALIHNLHHNRVLHQPLAILSLVTERRPYVPLDERLEFKRLDQNMYRLVAHYGFKQKHNVPNILDQCRQYDVDFTGPETTFFLGHLVFDVTGNRGLSRWRKRLFAWMAKNARDASKYFGIPATQVIEIGSRLEI